MQVWYAQIVNNEFYAHSVLSKSLDSNSKPLNLDSG